MQQRIEKLEKQVKWLGACVLILATVVVSLITLAAKSEPDSAKVLRVRGLIIEDDQGRERILIGAPIPAAKNRVRTDLERVKAIWGKQMPPVYADLYKTYDNTTNGILVLDANGFDRIAIGDPVPDPNVGKRIGASTGFAVNDEKGFERFGYGLLTVGGRHRVTLGLDNENGQDAAGLIVQDGGMTGLMLSNADRDIYFGNAPNLGEIQNTSEGPFYGLTIRQGKEVKYEMNFANSKPAQK